MWKERDFAKEDKHSPTGIVQFNILRWCMLHYNFTAKVYVWSIFPLIHYFCNLYLKDIVLEVAIQNIQEINSLIQQWRFYQLM